MWIPILAQETSFEFQASGEISPIFWIIYLVLIVIVVASLWVLFTKAGKPGWAAIIPIYNIIVLLEIVGRPIWWIILFLIPIVNFIVAIMVYIDLAKSFGKDTLWGCLILLLPFIFLPLLAFGDSQYEGPAAA